MKFFLHLSKEEQRRRFLARIDDPDKNWKLSRPDIEERGRWQNYQQAYEECLTVTITNTAPRYVVPADDKENARLIVSQIIPDSVDELKMSFPKPDKTRRNELQSIRKILEKQPLAQ